MNEWLENGNKEWVGRVVQKNGIEERMKEGFE